MGHEVRCRKNKIRSVFSNRELLDVFATEGSQVTAGQTALLRESQAGLQASPRSPAAQTRKVLQQICDKPGDSSGTS